MIAIIDTLANVIGILAGAFGVYVGYKALKNGDKNGEDKDGEE